MQAISWCVVVPCSVTREPQCAADAEATAAALSSVSVLDWTAALNM